MAPNANARVVFQNPSDPETEYLLEAFIGCLNEAHACEAVFAFATKDGVDAVFMDPAVEGFFAKGGEFDLIVGIDAITNRPALERLQALMEQHARLRVRVFWNPGRGLFHPKIAMFSTHGGDCTILVGSGNLTTGGLRINYEAFAEIEFGSQHRQAKKAWQTFKRVIEDKLGGIDGRALDRAARNVAVRRRGPREVQVVEAESPTDGDRGIAPPIDGEDSVLIAELPAAGNRWAQAHFNRDVIETYFQVLPNTNQRLFLQARSSGGTWGEQEVRPCVQSQRNLNLKVELAAAKDLAYPTGERKPITLFVRVGTRSFHYMVLMPGGQGYANVARLLAALPRMGRGTHRSVTSLDRLRSAWPGCPLLDPTP